MKKILVVSLIIGIIISSCSSKLKTIITGIWGAEECLYNGQRIEYDMFANIYSFDKSNACRMPIFDRSQLHEGTWELNENDSIITLDVKDNFFTGSYKVHFEKDYDRKVLFMILENDSIYLKGAKAFYNFDTGKTGVFQ